MMIVDAQVHIWAASTPERPWPPIVDPTQSRPHKAEPITADDMLREMAAAGVDRAVIAPPVREGVRNDVALAAAQAHPDRFAVMGRVDLNFPASRDLLPTWRQQPGMLGLRYALGRPLIRPLLTEGRIDWLWPAAEKAGLPLMLFPLAVDLHLIDRIAERHPALRITIDHLALGRGKDEEAFREFDLLLPLAKRPNIAVNDGCLSVSVAASLSAPRLRCVRPAAHVLGQRSVAAGVQLPRLRHHVHRGDALAVGQRPRMDHGPRVVRMDRVEVVM